MKIFVSVVAILLHQVLGDASTELASRASNEFSNILYKEVAKEPGNVLVCPLSLHVALTLLHQGAGGKTAEELRGVLKLSGDDTSIRESYKSILTGTQDNILKIATKLYPAVGPKLSQNFARIAQEYFLSDVQGLNYNKPQEAANIINKYVEEKTNNKIHDLISADSINSLTRLIIINAVHFNANWKIPFPHAYDDDFKVSPTERVKTRMMTVTDNFYYKDFPEIGAKVLRMDYEKGGYSMLIVLPNADDGLPAVENKLSTMRLEELMSGMNKKKVEVTIPKFKLEQTIKLNKVLMDLGLTDMFSTGADIRKLFEKPENIYVSEVIQKTFINVHENGTEAAAATGFLQTLSAFTDWETFYAKTPFHIYLIHREAPEQVLFEGRLVKPEENSYIDEFENLSEEDELEFIQYPEDSYDFANRIGNGHHQDLVYQNHKQKLPDKITAVEDNKQSGQSENQLKRLTNQKTQNSEPVSHLYEPVIGNIHENNNIFRYSLFQPMQLFSIQERQRPPSQEQYQMQEQNHQTTPRRVMVAAESLDITPVLVFRGDHPFLFYLAGGRNGMFLFNGRLYQPMAL